MHLYKSFPVQTTPNIPIYKPQSLSFRSFKLWNETFAENSAQPADISSPFPEKSSLKKHIPAPQNFQKPGISNKITLVSNLASILQSTERKKHTKTKKGGGQP